MDPLGHFLIGYVALFSLCLIIIRRYFEELKYWTLGRYIFFTQFIAVAGGLFALFPDLGDALGIYDTDTETWANLYFFHYSIDNYYHSLTENVRVVFEVLPIIFLGAFAIIINFWALRQIIRYRVKSNEVGKRLCKLADEYVGGIGPVIVQNVCVKSGFTLDSISTDEVTRIAGPLGKALGKFTGDLMSKEIRDEMSKIMQVPVYYNEELLNDKIEYVRNVDVEERGNTPAIKKLEKTLMQETKNDRKKAKKEKKKPNYTIKTLTNLYD